MGKAQVRSSGSGKTSVSMKFHKDNGIYIGLNKIKGAAAKNFTEYMSSRAQEVETYMKNNHPWQNRTGRAERGLHVAVSSVVQDSRTIVQLGLYHDKGTWYWRHLEYGMGRRFAIIEPTQRYFGPRILSEFDFRSLYFKAGNKVR